jgi:hypothetical protein
VLSAHGRGPSEADASPLAAAARPTSIKPIFGDP